MTFDPKAFMDTTVTGAMETKFPKIPENKDGYKAYIKDYDGRVAKYKDKQTGADTEAPVLDVTWVIDDEGVRNETGLPEPTIRQSLFLDLNSAGQLELGTGKNIQLGRLREALGQNDPAKPWSFSMLRGATAKVAIKHAPNQKDPNDPYVNVAGVTKL